MVILVSLIAPLKAILPPIDILSGRVKWRPILSQGNRLRLTAFWIASWLAV